MLLEFQKVQLRRHLKYPIIGLPVVSPTSGLTSASGQAGYRFFDAYGYLEWRMNNMNAIEEATLLGLAYGSVFINAVPAPAFQQLGQQIYVPSGSSVSVTLSGAGLGSPVVVTYTAGANTTPLQFAYALAQAAAANVTLASAGFFAVAPQGAGGSSENTMPLPEVSFTNAQTFTITVSSSLVGAQLSSGAGQLQPPVMTVPDPTTNQPVTTYGYVPLLNAMESAWLETTQNLDTARADVWTWNSRELEMREKQYTMLASKTALYVGIAPGTATGVNQAAVGGSLRTL